MAGPRRIPGATRNVSDNWADHRARGSLGGTDFTDGYGTTMHAMAGGYVIAVDNSPSGSGGRMVTILHDDGDQTEELHADTITAFRGMRVEWGQAVGISGASGFGDDWYYGPHIHAHGVDPWGRRYDIEPYIVFGLASPAGTAGEVITDEEEEDEFMVQQINYDKQVLAVTEGATTWLLIDTRSGFYSETIDRAVAALWVAKHGDAENVTYAEATRRKQACADLRAGGQAQPVKPWAAGMAGKLSD